MRRQLARVAITVIGVGVAVAMIATLFGFFAATEATMTQQAIADVSVDWQVQLASGSDPAAATTELQSSPGYTKVAQVGYFTTPGFQATTSGSASSTASSTAGNTVQTTGEGKVLGLGDGYRDAFPAQIRDLAGAGSTLLAQQTAANLHAVPGSMVTIDRPGLAPVQVKVDAIVDLPLADSLFQTIGAVPGTAPQAPPDNVLLMPLATWHALFDPVARISPDALSLQLHASIPHTFASSPTTAFTQVAGKARNYETRLAGAGIVGDNLAARLDAARSDALYARVLFLFLGLPGAILAMLLTAVFVASSASRRRRDQALLRMRGATAGRLLQLSALESAIVGIPGSVFGLVLGSAIVRGNFGRWQIGSTPQTTLFWSGIATAIGLTISFAMILLPAWWDARTFSVQSSRVAVRRQGNPVWERFGLDFIFLAISGVLYWQAARGGYKLVLAPEGVPTVSVSYTSFFAPLLLWCGAGLLVIRLTRILLARNGRIVTPLLRGMSAQLAPLVGASMSRQRGRVALGLTMVVLAVAFAISTSIFNATYEAQARVDAQLSNGADVTVSGGAAANLASRQAEIAKLPGVQHVEPMQHRFAYVGTDLQDLFGVNPVTFPSTAHLSDAFFVNGTAQSLMNALAQTPNGVLVSQETVTDFQLQVGDTVKLRLQSAVDQQYHVVPFTYVGIAREFPTAPHDSFLVANARYIAAQTQSPAVETLLLKTGSASGSASGSAQDGTGNVGASVRSLLGSISGATVHDIQDQQRAINSGLTAVSLRGLTRIELVFAVLLSAAGAGLVLFLGLDERRRMLAITTALGAKPRQLGAFVWSEAGLVLVGGLVGGLALGWGIAHMLIKLLTTVFDPPPEGATIPWLYVSLIVAVTIASVAVAGDVMGRMGRRGVLPTIRSL
jgi:putative ABC transport system permease protein